jgi:hypothetical protein
MPARWKCEDHHIERPPAGKAECAVSAGGQAFPGSLEIAPVRGQREIGLLDRAGRGTHHADL